MAQGITPAAALVAAALVISGCVGSLHRPARETAGPSFVRLTTLRHVLVGRWRDADNDSVSVVIAQASLDAPAAPTPWRVGADIPGDSVVLTLAWSDVERWEVATDVREQRTPRALAVAAGFAGAMGGALLVGGANAGATGTVVGAAVAGALLGASQPERRMQWRPAPIPRSRGVLSGGL